MRTPRHPPPAPARPPATSRAHLCLTCASGRRRHRRHREGGSRGRLARAGALDVDARGRGDAQDGVDARGARPHGARESGARADGRRGADPGGEPGAGEAQDVLGLRGGAHGARRRRRRPREADRPAARRRLPAVPHVRAHDADGRGEGEHRLAHVGGARVQGPPRGRARAAEQAGRHAPGLRQARRRPQPPARGEDRRAHRGKPSAALCPCCPCALLLLPLLRPAAAAPPLSLTPPSPSLRRSSSSTRSPRPSSSSPSWRTGRARSRRSRRSSTPSPSMPTR